MKAIVLVLLAFGCGASDETFQPDTTIAQATNAPIPDEVWHVPGTLIPEESTGACGAAINLFSVLPARNLDGAPYSCAGGCTCRARVVPSIDVAQDCPAGSMWIYGDRAGLTDANSACTYAVTPERQK